MSAPDEGFKDWLDRTAPVDDLRLALQKALRDLDKAKRDKQELVDALYRAAHDAVSAITVPKVIKPTADKRKGDSETAIIALSDFQLGKVTPTYNSEVCEQRIKFFADKVERLVAIQRADHPVRECRIYLIGDLVEGELIFPGQSHLIDASLYRQVMVDGPRILAEFVYRMAAIFEKVHIVGVIGNHGSLGGRARRDYHPETNADAMLYRVVEMLTADEKRITWAANFRPGERNWYATDKVGDKTWFLFHGDQVRGGHAGFPWYGFGKRLLGWNYSVERFDYALSGHFHTPVNQYLNGIRHWGNGSTESDNTYAAEQLAASGEPAQWLLFQHPTKGVSAEYLVRLED